MPDRLAGYGEDDSPELLIDDIPEDTVSIAVVMDDLDHPNITEFINSAIVP